jgi:two-component system response regulator AlgR
MRVLIVDDEEPARLRLRALLGDLAAELAITDVAEAADADAALARLQAHPADAVLLDIHMPGVHAPTQGLRLAEALRGLALPPALIFVTAHTDHALAAFELEAADYLTKPVRLERLRAALQRVQQRLRLAAAAASQPGGAAAIDGPVLVVGDRGRVLRLPIAEVLVLKAELKYVTLRTATREHVLDQSLAELEQRLAELGGRFVRVHRNALVARHAIRAFELRPLRDAEAGTEGEGWAVRVAPLDEWLAVSRRQVAAVRAALEGGVA